MDKRILEIKKNLESKTTEELQQIYQEKDTDKWSTAAFWAIESILKDRSVLQDLESNDIQAQQLTVSPEAGKSFNRKLKEGYKWETQKEFYSDLQSSLIGKRNLWVWLYGIIVPISFVALSALEISELKGISEPLMPKNILSSLYLFAFIVSFVVVFVGMSFFFRQTWAIKAYYCLPFVGLFVFYLIMHDKINIETFTVSIGRTIGASIIPFIIYYIITSSVRNRLFFGFQVLDWQIEEYWLRRSNNRANLSACIAVSFPGLILLTAHTIGVLSSKGTQIALSVLIISVMFWTIWLANTSRKKENLDAVPPIGGKEYAIFAVVMASLWIIAMLILIVSALSA